MSLPAKASLVATASVYDEQMLCGHVPHRLDENMKIFGRVVLHFEKGADHSRLFEVIQDTKGNERSDALAVGRALMRRTCELSLPCY